jgi:hypothetical protein
MIPVRQRSRRSRGGLFGKVTEPRSGVQLIDRNRHAVELERITLTTLLRTFLENQPAKIAAQITEAIGNAEKADKPKKKAVDRILSAVDLSDWVEIVPDAERIIVHVAQDGGGEALSQVGVNDGGITEQVNEDALDWAHARAAELVGMEYDEDGNLVPNADAEWAITDSTREMLRSDVETAMEDGMSTDDLAQALSGRYAFSGARAETIARTELARADVQGNMIAYKQSGVVSGKEWLLGSEHVDSDECDDAEAMGVVPLDSDFGGIGDPPAHPNCVCDVAPVLAGDEEIDE